MVVAWNDMPLFCPNKGVAWEVSGEKGRKKYAVSTLNSPLGSVEVPGGILVISVTGS